MPLNTTPPFVPAPPTVFAKVTFPALADTFNVLLLAVETDPLMAIFPPSPAPLTPVESAVESSVVLETKFNALPIVIAPAVTIFPLRFNVLGDETVNDPITLNVSDEPSFKVKVPVLLNTKL